METFFIAVGVILSAVIVAAGIQRDILQAKTVRAHRNEHQL